MTARHAARHHSGHVVPAIHVIRRCDGSFLVMMRGNLALAGRAAGGLIRRPCGSRERGIEQNNREQTEACGNRTAAMLIAEGHGWPAGNLILRQKACSSIIIPDGWRSHFRTLANKDSAILRILTWRPARRRLESWLTVVLSWVLARTRKRRSRRDTNSTFGSRHFAWTSGCSPSSTVLRATRAKCFRSTSTVRSQRLPPNPRERRQRVPRQKRRPKQAGRLRMNQRPLATGKSACW